MTQWMEKMLERLARRRRLSLGSVYARMFREDPMARQRNFNGDHPACTGSGNSIRT